jgi:hypothetical protein
MNRLIPLLLTLLSVAPFPDTGLSQVFEFVKLRDCFLPK